MSSESLDASARPQLRALLISHEERAAPAIIGEMLHARGVQTRRHIVLDPDRPPDTAFPDPSDFDLVVAFGSFHNAYDPAAAGWVDPEVRFIESTMAVDTPFVGVCFGGQLLSLALGGAVEKAPEGAEEVGVVQLRTTADWPLASGPWFAWHEDRVRLPAAPGIEVLAETDHAVQVFRAGRAIGLQFHPEVDQDLVRDWLAMGGEHHLPDEWSSERLLSVWAEAEPEAHRNCEDLVDWLLAELVGVSH